MNQSQVYVFPLPFEPPSPSHPSRLIHSPCFEFPEPYYSLFNISFNLKYSLELRNKNMGRNGERGNKTANYSAQRQLLTQYAPSYHQISVQATLPCLELSFILPLPQFCLVNSSNLTFNLIITCKGSIIHLPN